MRWKKVALIAAGVCALAVGGVVSLMGLGLIRAQRRIDAQKTTTIAFIAGGQKCTASFVSKPDGALVLEIADAAGAPYRSSISANPYMRFFMVEDAGDVWFYGDSGLYVYTRSPEGAWSEVGWTEGAVAAKHPIPGAALERMSERMRGELQRYRKTGS